MTALFHVKKRYPFLAFMGLWLLAATSCAAELTVQQAAQPVEEKKELIRVTVYQLVVDPSSRQPVVTLADPGETRALFIWIGLPEARAVYSEIEGIENPRPLTHDLLEKIIKKSNGAIHHIVITHSRDNIYYATIVLQKEENFVEIDARPSDSLGLALKFDAPIYVSRNLFEKMSLSLGKQTETQEAYGLSLQELTPDLAQYLAFESGKGVMVSGIQRGSPAERDGVQKGDIIVEVEGQAVENLIVFKKFFEKKPEKMKVFRNSKYLTLIIDPR